MTTEISYEFISKEEFEPADNSLDPPFSGKHTICLQASYGGKVKTYLDLVGTNPEWSDQQYADFMFNALAGRIYMDFGLPDPT
jgi:hypothetical protein